MIVYQPNFLFLGGLKGGLKACQFALSLLNKIHLTHIEQRKLDGIGTLHVIFQSNRKIKFISNVDMLNVMSLNIALNLMIAVRGQALILYWLI